MCRSHETFAKLGSVGKAVLIFRRILVKAESTAFVIEGFKLSKMLVPQEAKS